MCRLQQGVSNYITKPILANKIWSYVVDAQLIGFWPRTYKFLLNPKISLCLNFLPCSRWESRAHGRMSLDAIPSLCMYRPSSHYTSFVCEVFNAITLLLRGISFELWFSCELCRSYCVGSNSDSSWHGLVFFYKLNNLVEAFLTVASFVCSTYSSLGLGFCLSHLLCD